MKHFKSCSFGRASNLILTWIRIGFEVSFLTSAEIGSMRFFPSRHANVKGNEKRDGFSSFSEFSESTPWFAWKFKSIWFVVVVASWEKTVSIIVFIRWCWLWKFISRMVTRMCSYICDFKCCKIIIRSLRLLCWSTVLKTMVCTSIAASANMNILVKSLWTLPCHFALCVSGQTFFTRDWVALVPSKLLCWIRVLLQHHGVLGGYLYLGYLACVFGAILSKL